MPEIPVVFYQDRDGTAPVLQWLEELRRSGLRKVAVKCWERVERLAALGFELRRPLADLLRDGIYELRIRRGRVNYRILYFFHGNEAAVLVHGLTKEGKVPHADIERALQRKEQFEQDPEGRTYPEEEGDDDERR